MRYMKAGLWLAAGLLVVVLPVVAQDGATKGKVKSTQPTRSNQVLMQMKLKHTQQLLEGLATENFDTITENAKVLSMVSRAASWHSIPTSQYDRYRKDFEASVFELIEHAEDRDLDAATLDYVRLTINCIQCHKHVRDVKKSSEKKSVKPPEKKGKQK